MNKIYLEGTEEKIQLIFELAKNNLGNGINIIDINPELKEDDEQ